MKQLGPCEGPVHQPGLQDVNWRASTNGQGGVAVASILPVEPCTQPLIFNGSLKPWPGCEG